MEILNEKLSRAEIRFLAADLNPLLLPSCPIAEYRSLPSVRCIYFAIEADEVKYIGQTGDLRNRWKYHVCRGLLLGQGDRVAWLQLKPRGSRYSVHLEVSLIKRYQPQFNIQHVAHNRRRFRGSCERHEHAVRVSGLTLAVY